MHTHEISSQEYAIMLSWCTPRKITCARCLTSTSIQCSRHTLKIVSARRACTSCNTAISHKHASITDAEATSIMLSQVTPAQPPKLEEPVIESKPEDADQEELLMNVAPKKPNWDLKRDLQGKLDKLERRTQRAIIEIMNEEARARLEEDGGVQD
ncbi:cwf18 pre-mRNA splicing factor-domain-containing protein [Dunaliella salina]|uniref:Cwf18 pre-mRNA splicing factor-domain-containing protein n=1 Tax=Dunaliella salina TaxID=3046 RepID=A0ABQ7FXV9_DUNSA|nr:cwf18 pre-mRNA splicing factor-domain-containing protein [Dunaliella salina]|eukprot:KAF5827181.1 cwf18 pre-mRNA splicing factor-domain-containing protein [Dunaliella salina]